MLFNTLSFACFIVPVFLIYWFLKRYEFRVQNLFLLVASYIFYGFWDWRFVFLLLFSTLLDYCSGIQIAKTADPQKRKFWLVLSIVTNLGFLGFFKYYNFFIGSFTDLLEQFGLRANLWTLQVILPVGISFYTFHGLSYIIDIYRSRTNAENNLIDYALFVSYFPLLVAGPIERSTHLLPQLQKERNFNYDQAVDGLQQILWGLFKKMVIADRCAVYVNMIFDNPAAYSGSTLLIGATLFAFQIYGDFSGYSDIALGVSKLFGIDLMKNFNYPYFSRDVAEFWRRWHISLSTWFRDYVYIPLGGSRKGKWISVRNTFIIFIVSGFWHGANWTFVFWGFLHALFIMPVILLKRNRRNLEIVAKNKIFPTIKETIAILLTFILTTLAWVFFRADSIRSGFSIIGSIFSPTLFSMPEIRPSVLLFPLIFLFLVEWWGRESDYGIQSLPTKKSPVVRWAFYLLLGFIIFWLKGEGQGFIYFQF